MRIISREARDKIRARSNDSDCDDAQIKIIFKGDNVQAFKSDKGKPRLSLVPSQVIRDIAEVREYGVRKYGDSKNWKRVEIERYREAAYRHLLAYIDNPGGVDEESGIKHLKHLACNVAFLCEIEGEMKIEKQSDDSETH